MVAAVSIDEPFERNAWHTLSIERALAAAETTLAGLRQAEAEARLLQFGANRLPPPTPVSALKILKNQLTGVVIILLFAAAAISIALADYVEAAAISIVLVINTTIGFVTEWRARRAMEALRQLDVSRASVIRDGHLQLIDADRLVPGDIIEVAAGHAVPADVRLVATTDFRVDESALTGESMPVSKSSFVELDSSTDLADRTNMAFKGTAVVAGFARAVVIATATRTELGRIGTLVESVEPESTPLEKRLDALGRRLVWLTLGISVLVTVLGATQSTPLVVLVETAIALAVAAVPEALPAVATIALAVGMRRMARRHALVRRLPVVETLGSTTVVCTDKTRTLTTGEMAVVRVWASGRSSDPLAVSDQPDAAMTRLIRSAALACRRQVTSDEAGSRRDPVDAAILQAAERLPGQSSDGISDDAPLALIPFSSERKWMAGFYRREGAVVAFAKGAPRTILERSTAAALDDRDVMLDAAGRQALVDVNDDFASRGLRVLAVATGTVREPSESSIRALRFLGFIGLADPPAAGVKDTIAELRAAGLRTIMLTGDQRLTAEAVGRSVGVLGTDATCLDGRELDRLDASALDAAIGRVAAFSRVTPEHKLRIVGALQARGEIVAMLGDGINDAAALKRADVGVAMGRRGTDVAKEAAAIVLQDDRFETIAAAVEEGRVIFDNIQKFVFYLFSCNVAEILVVLLSVVAGLPLPLAPLQLLWLNMVTDTFPALALALEPGDLDVMRRPPRDPNEAILSPSFLARVLSFGALITASSLGAFVWGLVHAPDRAPTLAFMTLALAQIGHLGNARSRGPVLRLQRVLANPYALLGAALALGLQLLAAFFRPLAELLQVVPLEPIDWLVVVALGSLPAMVGQAAKLRWRSQ